MSTKGGPVFIFFILSLPGGRLAPFPPVNYATGGKPRSFILCSRAGLKPMQPMRLHWAPRLRGPRAMVVGQVVYFCQILLAHENCIKTY